MRSLPYKSKELTVSIVVTKAQQFLPGYLNRYIRRDNYRFKNS